MTMMAKGFTVVRDLGNNANYADTALRVGIEQGWIPGPTLINSGLIIGGFGSQFSPVPEREALIYPEYRRWLRREYGALVGRLPLTAYHAPNPDRFKRQTDGMRNAYANYVKMAFSTDADYYIPGMTRGEVVLDFLKSWKAAEIPAPEILKIMTVNGYAVSDISEKRGPIKADLPADLIAMPTNPLQDIDALRDVRFVMKDGTVFKKDGVMVPEKFFHSGPVNGWRVR